MPSPSSLARLAGLLAAAGATLGAFAQGAPMSPAEQPVAAQDKLLIEAAFTKADGNGDGALSRDEAARVPSLAGRFDALDRDRDGRLSLEEFATGVIAPP